MFTAACIQIQGSSDVARNLRVTETLIRRAAAMGCALIATPEATTYLGPHSRKITLAEPVDGPTHRRLGALAAERVILPWLWVLAASPVPFCALRLCVVNG